MKRFLAITLVTLTFSAQEANAQVVHRPAASTASSATSQQPTEKSVQASEPSELYVAKQQIKLLEAQLDVTKKYHDSLLQTVYWSLSGVFVVVGLLLGFGWLANFRVYERDKESLRSDMQAATSKAASDLTTTVQKSVTELESSIQSQAQSNAEELEARLKELVAEALKPVTATISRVDGRVFSLQLERRKELMNTNGSDNMALTDALELLELCHKRAQGEVPDILHFMLKKFDAGGKLTANEITRLNAILDMLPAHYKTLTDKVRAKLIASDIF